MTPNPKTTPNPNPNPNPEPTPRTRVLIVDDHPMVRLGLRTMLERFPAIDIVGDAATAAEAVELATRTLPNVVLLDIRLGQESGLTACRDIRQLQRGIRILVLTSYSDETTIFDAMSAGADGYLLKEINGDALVRGILDVAAGRIVLDPVVTQTLGRFDHPELHTDRGRLDRLSPRERSILALVAEGKTNKEIAASLGLSDKTVKNYLSHILEKLSLTRRSHAAAFYIRHQFS